MFTFHSAIIRWLEWVFSPFKSRDPVWALMAVSLITSLVFLEVFRRTTHAAKLQEARNRMQAHLLEVRLFKDSPSIVLAALAGMLAGNLRYLRHSLKPTLLMLPPLLVLMIHLDGWFGHTPLRPGQAALVRVKLQEAAQQTLDSVSLEPSAGLTIETPSLRIPLEKEISWAVRPSQTGEYPLKVRGPGGAAEKMIVVSEGGWERAAPRRVTAGFWNQWTFPGEALLPRDGPIEWIEVGYPDRSLTMLGWEAHWLVIFFVLTCAFGFAGSKLLRVTL